RPTKFETVSGAWLPYSSTAMSPLLVWMVAFCVAMLTASILPRPHLRRRRGGGRCPSAVQPSTHEQKKRAQGRPQGGEERTEAGGEGPPDRAGLRTQGVRSQGPPLPRRGRGGRDPRAGRAGALRREPGTAGRPRQACREGRAPRLAHHGRQAARRDRARARLRAGG